MIVEWLVSVGCSIAAWFPTLFPSWLMPSWVTNVVSSVQGFLAASSGLGVWIPWVTMNFVLGTLVTVYGITFGIKLLRVIAAHIPQFGGAG